MEFFHGSGVVREVRKTVRRQHLRRRVRQRDSTSDYVFSAPPDGAIVNAGILTIAPFPENTANAKNSRPCAYRLICGEHRVREGFDGAGHQDSGERNEWPVCREHEQRRYPSPGRIWGDPAADATKCGNVTENFLCYLFADNLLGTGSIILRQTGEVQSFQIHGGQAIYVVLSFDQPNGVMSGVRLVGSMSSDATTLAATISPGVGTSKPSIFGDSVAVTFVRQ